MHGRLLQYDNKRVLQKRMPFQRYIDSYDNIETLWKKYERDK